MQRVFQETLGSGRAALLGISLKSHQERLILDIGNCVFPREGWEALEWAAQGVVESLSMETFPKNWIWHLRVWLDSDPKGLSRFK